jgi:hypothetical protein
MRLTDVDNQKRLELARTLYHMLAECRRQKAATDYALLIVQNVAHQHAELHGKKIRQAEIWTLKERLYTCELDIRAISARLDTMIADLSRRSGETESHIRQLLGN